MQELETIQALMRDFPLAWAIGGGWAIDLFLNRVTRQHKDIDIIIFRRDQLAIQQHLKAHGWTLEYVSKSGELTVWKDEQFLELPVHTIWCKHPDHQPDFIEVLFNEIEDDCFVFRRDQTIQLSLSRALMKSESGLPILAPEIAL
jgi:hypothetical protein